MSDDKSQPPETDGKPYWRDDGTLISGHFDDVYFSQDGGLDETRHVFLAGCDLPGRWQDRARFTLAETGFGTGLNMLAAWQAFREASGQCQQLDLISVEAYPLTKSDLSRALSGWDELGDLRAQLLAQYPPLEEGFHRLVFDEGRVRLTLIFGEAAAMFSQLTARVDAWFLDGFSPAKNPEMWREAVMDQVARLSAPDAVAASFTVARAVRDRLAERGFVVEKAPGFGRKRQCLRATRTGPRRAVGHVPPTPSFAVIGAGIAGSAMAAALAVRGHGVTVIDPRPDLSHAASGNPIGIVMPRLHLGDNPVTAFNDSAWRFAKAWYGRLPPLDDRPALNDCGVLQLARNADEAARFARLAARPHVAGRSGTLLDSGQAEFMTGEPAPFGGLWLPEAGWVQPARLCEALRDHSRVLLLQGAVATIERRGAGWVLKNTAGKAVASADVVIIANGLNSRQYNQATWQPLRPKRGQITELTADDNPQKGPRCITTFGHYLSPVIDGRRVLGASYDHWDDAVPTQWPTPDPASDAANQVALATALPGLAARLTAVAAHRAALRATTPDHLPLAGAAPKADEPGASHDGLYLLTGLGSTGLVTAPLCAEVICAQLFDEPMPATHTTVEAMAPARFIERAVKRGVPIN